MAFDPVYEILDPLVGTPNASHNFEMLLRQFVRGEIPPDEAIYMECTGDGYCDEDTGIAYPDRYWRLEAGLRTILDLPTLDLPSNTSRQLDRKGSLMTAARLAQDGGAEFATLAVRAVGDIYKEKAVVPQQREGVMASVVSALAYLVHTAMMDRSTATRDIRAVSHGDDPNDPGVRIRYALPTINEASADTLVPAFVVSGDEDEGQLRVRPRFRLRGRNPDNHCPAVDMRVRRSGNKDRRTVSALWEYMSVIARVAVDEIYPYEFAIVPE